MGKRITGLLISAALFATGVSAQTVAPSPLGSAVERQLSTEQTFSLWARDPDRVKSGAGDRLEPRHRVGETFETVKLKNVSPPIHFECCAPLPEIDDVRNPLIAPEPTDSQDRYGCSKVRAR